MEIEITSFSQFAQECKKPLVLVDFYATWCGPCKMLSPIVEKVADEHPELTVLKVDVDANRDIASHYGIASIPTLLLFKQGELIKSDLGYMPEPRLKAFIGF